MLSQHGGRAIWIHHHECGFDWKLIDKYRPDEVWWVPTERYLVCDPGVTPLNFEPEGP
jgi:alginate O-acetyltransferase complex protein AlgJ